jgi:chemotaxis protein CheX
MQTACVRGKTLLLPADLDHVAAASLFEVLSSLIGTDVVIEGSRVEHIGGQCLQILLAAASTWKTDGAVLEFVNPSLEFIAGLELLGVPEIFWVGSAFDEQDDTHGR